AATVAIWYAAAPNTVTASCVDDSDTLSSDQNICDESYVTSHGGHYDSGTGIFFLPYGGGYRQYHYYYGGSVDPRTQHVSGGTIAAPSGWPSGPTTTTCAEFSSTSVPFCPISLICPILPGSRCWKLPHQSTYPRVPIRTLGRIRTV
ncbi:hypothetical protein ACFQ1S_43010, partial [Kibdelosporangium lantanae]